MLWLDPDPDTAAWTLMLQRTLQPGSVVTSNLPRPGLGSSAFLQAQLAQNPKQLTPPWCIWPLQPALPTCHQQD